MGASNARGGGSVWGPGEEEMVLERRALYANAGLCYGQWEEAQQGQSVAPTGQVGTAAHKPRFGGKRKGGR